MRPQVGNVILMRQASTGDKQTGNRWFLGCWSSHPDLMPNSRFSFFILPTEKTTFSWTNCLFDPGKCVKEYVRAQVLQVPVGDPWILLSTEGPGSPGAGLWHDAKPVSQISYILSVVLDQCRRSFNHLKETFEEELKARTLLQNLHDWSEPDLGSSTSLFQQTVLVYNYVWYVRDMWDPAVVWQRWLEVTWLFLSADFLLLCEFSGDADSPNSSSLEFSINSTLEIFLN